MTTICNCIIIITLSKLMRIVPGIIYLLCSALIFCAWGDKGASASGPGGEVYYWLVIWQSQWSLSGTPC